MVCRFDSYPSSYTQEMCNFGSSPKASPPLAESPSPAAIFRRGFRMAIVVNSESLKKDFVEGHRGNPKCSEGYQAPQQAKIAKALGVGVDDLIK